MFAWRTGMISLILIIFFGAALSCSLIAAYPAWMARGRSQPAPSEPTIRALGITLASPVAGRMDAAIEARTDAVPFPIRELRMPVLPGPSFPRQIALVPVLLHAEPDVLPAQHTRSASRPC